MKNYLGPLILAVTVNLLVAAALLRLHFFEHANNDTKPPAVQINLNKFVQHLNKTSKNNESNDQNWLKKHYGKEINIQHRFSAGKNLTGYVISLKSDPEARSVIYSVNHGEYYFMGTVIDNHGQNISQANAHHYIKNPLDKKIYHEAQSLPGIVQGDPKAPQAIIIIDPNSNLFPSQWTDLLYDVEQGVFSIKWVLVNYLKPMGPNVAGDVLEAKNKVTALNYNAKHYNKNTQTGGYVKNIKVSTAVNKSLRNNWSFVQKYNLYKLPVTIAKSHNRYYVIQGAVMDETLEAIFADNRHPST